MSTETVRASILRALKAYAGPGSNLRLQAYLGSPFPVLGVSAAEMREVMKARIDEFKKMSINELNDLAELLWTGRTFEEKTFAISLFRRFAKSLDKRSWSTMNRWINQSEGWALCDSLGSGPVSAMLYREQELFKDVLRWTQSTNLSRRRVSAYAMRDFVSAGELKKPFTLLERLLYDEQFWVQRAVGTWLRECWKKDKQGTEKFLLKHASGLPRVVITVAAERASKAFRRSLRLKPLPRQ